jgi:hypothetical protein
MIDPRTNPSSAPPNSGTQPSSSSAPGPASVEAREALFIRLLYASDRLARSRVQAVHVPARVEMTCRECRAKGAQPVHGPYCKTGEVLAVVNLLTALTPAEEAKDQGVRP